MTKQRKQTKTLTALLLAGLCATGAQAQSLKNDGWYGEVGYLGMKLTNDIGASGTPKLVRLTVGKEVMKNLAVEGMLGLTVSKSTYVDQKESDTLSALYVKPHWEIAPGTDVFVRAGLAHNAYKATYIDDGSSASQYSMNKFSYGLGVQTQFTKEIYGALDYMYYGKYSDSTLYMKHTGFTASIGYRF